jgi:surface polysaccharide O-acyltransferase-like enzyme
MMKIILAVIIVISWACGLYVYLINLKTQSVPTPFDYLFPLIFVINVLCGRYLYSRAKDKKTEWALFGLLFSINAIVTYWIWNSFKERHKQGKSIFGPE